MLQQSERSIFTSVVLLWFITIDTYNWVHIPLFTCALKNITVSEDNPKFKSIDGSLYTKDGKNLVQYAGEKENKYFVVPDSVEWIYTGAFKYSALQIVVIGDNVEYIGSDAFSPALKYVCFTASSWQRFNNYDFNDVPYNSVNSSLFAATWCCYREKEPGENQSGFYWHYVDGVPTIW